MTDAINTTMDLIIAQVKELEAELARKRRMVNDLAALAELPPVYEVIEDVDSSPSRRDAYYGVSLNDAVEMVLQRRKRLGAASVSEIYDALVAGGYKFQTKNEQNAKRGLYGTLSNDAVFHRLPSGLYGLLVWYPEELKRFQQQKKDAANGTSSKSKDSDSDGRTVMDQEFGESEAKAEAGAKD